MDEETQGLIEEFATGEMCSSTRGEIINAFLRVFESGRAAGAKGERGRLLTLIQAFKVPTVAGDEDTGPKDIDLAYAEGFSWLRAKILDLLQDPKEEV